MNVIFILCDTLTRDKLSPYHQHQGQYGYIQTPNIERLAKRSITFTNHWIASAPCMPARRDLWTGRIEFPWRSWGPRESFDPDWALTLRDSDTMSVLFTDHANLFDVGAGNYHHWFDEYHFVRGHFNDHCATVLPVAPGRAGHTRQIYREVQKQITSEADTFVARNLTNVIKWLDTYASSGRDDSFFLCIDEFDPHWPLDPPEPYRSMYLDDHALIDLNLDTFYKSAWARDYSAYEIQWLNAQCAGKITLVDYWLSQLFDCLDRHQFWDDTLVILTTDHGEFIGEYGQMSKGSGFSYPLFARIPLFVALPGANHDGVKSDALTCTIDLHATVLDALGQTVSVDTHSHSLLPLLRSERSSIRESVLYGWWGKGFYWTDGEFLLCKAPEQAGPLYQYGTNLGEKWVGLGGSYLDRYANAEIGSFMPHTERPVYRVPSDGMAYAAPDADFDALFDLKRDPDCLTNLYATLPELRQKYLGELKVAMHTLSVPHEHFMRLGLGMG